MTAAAKLLDRLQGVRQSGPGRWLAKCPAHEDRSPSLSVRELDDGTALIKCFGGCGAADVLAAVGLELKDLFPRRGRAGHREIDAATWAIYRDEPRRAGHRPQPTRATAPTEHRTLSEYGRELWCESQSLAGAARAYLEARACVIPPADGDLRWHPKLRHAPTGYEGPALVALVTDATTCEPLSLHRTWVRADGTKAADPARLLLKGHRKAGGVIRLWPDDAVTHGLAIAEGIETALSVAHAFKPTWAAIDAGNLGELPVLAGIEALTIVADADPAGTKAAERCAERWASAMCKVRIAIPENGDANDVVRATT